MQTKQDDDLCFKYCLKLTCVFVGFLYQGLNIIIICYYLVFDNNFGYVNYKSLLIFYSVKIYPIKSNDLACRMFSLFYLNMFDSKKYLQQVFACIKTDKYSLCIRDLYSLFWYRKKAYTML